MGIVTPAAGADLPITESPIPRPPPEPEAVLIPFDGINPLQGPYVNALTHYAHLAAQKKLAPGTTTRKHHGLGPPLTLVLLPASVTGWCLTTGKTITFNAALLIDQPDHTIEGWLISTHELGILLYQDMINESTKGDTR